MGVYKDKLRGTYYVKYKNTTKRGFKTKKEAKLFENKVLRHKRFNDEYFCAVARGYLKHLEQTSKYSTYMKCQQVMEDFIIKNFPDKKISNITPQDCFEFRIKLSNSSYSTTTKNYILQKFKKVFKHAMTYNDLFSDPSVSLTSFQKTLEEDKNETVKKNTIWDENDFNQFIKYVDDNVYKVFFITLFYTGARLGEIRALTWNDFSRGKINIIKSVTSKTDHVADNRKEEIVPTKTSSSKRRISVGSSLNEMLKDLKKQEQQKEGFNNDWFIFGGPRTLPTTSIDRKRQKAIKLSGVPFITNHGFRHSSISLWINKGVTITEVSKRVGHKNPGVTLGIYTHANINEDDKLLDILNNLQSETIKSSQDEA